MSANVTLMRHLRFTFVSWICLCIPWICVGCREMAMKSSSLTEALNDQIQICLDIRNEKGEMVIGVGSVALSFPIEVCIGFINVGDADVFVRSDRLIGMNVALNWNDRNGNSLPTDINVAEMNYYCGTTENVYRFLRGVLATRCKPGTIRDDQTVSIANATLLDAPYPPENAAILKLNIVVWTRVYDLSANEFRDITIRKERCFRITEDQITEWRRARERPEPRAGDHDGLY